MEKWLFVDVWYCIFKCDFEKNKNFDKKINIGPLY